MPWSAGTAGNQRKSHRAPLVDESNTAETGQSGNYGIPDPALDAENAPPSKEEEKPCGGRWGKSSEDESPRWTMGTVPSTPKSRSEPETDSRGSAQRG